MAKFKVRLKVTGFELEVEGSREDVPLIAQSVGQQFTGMLQPAADIVEGEIVSDDSSRAEAPTNSTKPSTKKRTSSRRKSSVPSNSGAASEDVLNWVHDPAKWGNPQQRWVTSQKAIWLLYVARHETGTTYMSSSLIAYTFNKHFPQAKTIQVSKVSRDLGRLKVKKDSAVGENTTQTPPAWFLTQKGEEEARKLVLEALGQTNSPDSRSES